MLVLDEIGLSIYSVFQPSTKKDPSLKNPPIGEKQKPRHEIAAPRYPM